MPHNDKHVGHRPGRHSEKKNYNAENWRDTHSRGLLKNPIMQSVLITEVIYHKKFNNRIKPVSYIFQTFLLYMHQ